MKRILCYLECVAYIVCVNIVTFCLRPMSWNLLSDRLLNRDIRGLWETAGNFFIWFVTVFSLALLFHILSTGLPFSVFVKTFLTRCLWQLILVRLSADLLLLFVEIPFGNTIFSVVIEMLSMFLTFWLIRKEVCLEKTPAHKRKKYHALIGGIAMGAAVCLYAFCCYAYAAEARNLIDKYTDSAFLSEIPTADFKLHFMNCLFSIVLWSVLFLYFDLFHLYYCKQAGIYKGTKLLARCTCLVVASMGVMGIKILICPVGSICNFEQLSRYTDSEQTDIHDDYSTITVKRKQNYMDSEIVFKNTKVVLNCGNNRILTFSRKPNQDTGSLQTVDIADGTSAYRYDFDAVAYVKDGRAFALEFAKINRYNKQDDCLIEICKQLIREGYFEALEYSYNYLYQYDKAFILPYLQAASKGELGDCLDHHKNSYIKQSYMNRFPFQLENHEKRQLS